MKKQSTTKKNTNSDSNMIGKKRKSQKLNPPLVESKKLSKSMIINNSKINKNIVNNIKNIGSHKKALTDDEEDEEDEEKQSPLDEKDTKKIFLNHLSRVLQGFDQCAAVCFYSEELLIATNEIHQKPSIKNSPKKSTTNNIFIKEEEIKEEIKEKSSEKKKKSHIKKSRNRIEIIEKAIEKLKSFSPGKLNNDFYEPYIDLLIENINLHLYGQAGVLNIDDLRTRFYFKLYMKSRNPIKLAPFVNTCLSHPDIVDRILKYCHSLHFIMKSRHLKILKDNSYEILKYDQKNVHAEMKIACYIMEKVKNKNNFDISKTNVYIGVSRRVCKRCQCIFQFMANQYKSKFSYRTCSEIYYDYPTPLFISTDKSRNHEFNKFMIAKDSSGIANRQDSLLFSGKYRTISCNSKIEFFQIDPNSEITEFCFKPLLESHSDEQISNYLTIDRINNILIHKIIKETPAKDRNISSIQKSYDDNSNISRKIISSIIKKQK
jgi:hypothetical protein